MVCPSLSCRAESEDFLFRLVFVHDEVHRLSTRNGLWLQYIRSQGFIQEGGKFVPEAEDFSVQSERYYSVARESSLTNGSCITFIQ